MAFAGMGRRPDLVVEFERLGLVLNDRGRRDIRAPFRGRLLEREFPLDDWRRREADLPTF